MSDLPEKVVRFDVLRVEYEMRKLCQCIEPHYEIDFQNRMVRCIDCGAIVEPFEALMRIARDVDRWTSYTEDLLEQRRQIESYQPRRVVIKNLEKKYNRSEHENLEPTCPRCGQPFELEELLNTCWVNRKFVRREDENAR